MSKHRIRSHIFVLAAAVIIGIGLGACEGRGDAKQYAVIISEEAKETEVYAAETLSRYLSEISSENIDVIYDTQPFEGYGFYVGDTAAFDTSDIEEMPDGSYYLAPFDRGLAVYGAGTRGTIYGIFGFLEDYCGFRCFTARTGLESVTGKITLPKKKISFQPGFEFTDTDWDSPSYPVYSLANGLNGGPHRMLYPEQGGAVEYLGSFCHTLSVQFCAAATYFDSHPEYFAFYEGERVPYQLCLTNGDVYRIVLSEVLDLLENEGDPEAALQIVSLSQADNLCCCQCENCRALDEKNGSPSGSILAFVNRIARAVKAAGYENAAIDTFAYQYSRKAPSKEVPEDNVIVRLCTIEGCFSHPLNDPDCPANAGLMRDLEDWNKICDRLYIWDYTTNYAYSIGIFPDFHVLQANMQCFYEHGVKGVYEEGAYYVSECDSEFGELRSYLISRLLRDPYCDFDREMKLFCDAFYGKGGSFIRTFVKEVTECTGDKHVSIYSPMTESFVLSEGKAAELDRLWDRALKASAGDEEALSAVKRSRLSWRYVKACLGLREFSGHPAENMKEREALYDDLVAHGIKVIDEWEALKPDFEPYRYILVEDWAYADSLYLLSFDANGGEDAPLYLYSNGYIVIWDEVPERKGYTFLGWSSDMNAEKPQYQPGEALILENDLILYAVWKKT